MLTPGIDFKIPNFYFFTLKVVPCQTFDIEPEKGHCTLRLDCILMGDAPLDGLEEGGSKMGKEIDTDTMR